MADVVATAKARLNDPRAPLGTFLFLGPTGVGKTAAAKALAKYLYGDEARLLRFDLNEFNDASSLSRLIGAFGQPDGLLTSAVRRQPYCVLLLDEIEKAHPAVFDLLLQVLGEGRLTDALGRTSDFTCAVVIMTSNLGTLEASTALGSSGCGIAAADLVDAAQRFFRPEFSTASIAWFRLTRWPEVRSQPSPTSSSPIFSAARGWSIVAACSISIPPR